MNTQSQADAEAEPLSSFVPGRVYRWVRDDSCRHMVVIITMQHTVEWITRPKPELLLMLLPGRAVPLICPCKRENWQETNS